MTKWYFPSYTGDFRLIASEVSSYREQADGSTCVLEIVDPAPHELPVLEAFLADAREKKWTPIKKIATTEVDGKNRQEILLAATIGEAGRLLYGHVRPADRTITGIRSTGGKIEVFETADLAKVEEALNPDAVVAAPEAKKDEKVAVTVKRPTPSCPQCVPGAISRASEVLMDFLTPGERQTWNDNRYVVAEGGLTHHRYVLAHRHSPIAAQIGRICFDLDDDIVIHFHDNSVPPEEEVLAAKLILEHREPWLRNEATTFGGFQRFKNPFGTGADGLAEAAQTRAIGATLKRLFG